jgi:hypothetical protein
MKRLDKCPGCGAGFTDNQHNEHWFMQTCANRCDTWYSQNLKWSHKDEEVSYITFNTDHFSIYAYYNDDGLATYPGKAYIYSRAVLEKHGRAMPLLILPVDRIDIDKREELDQSLQSLAMFT